MNDIIYSIKNNKLPGLDAQLKMAPPFRKNELKKEINTIELRPSAVLISIFKEAQDWFLILIKRSSDGGVHSNQMAFPGGKYEKTDANVQYTALRETEEEIGISTNNVSVIRQLSTMYILISGFKVFPFIGILNSKPQISLNNAEVEDIYYIPIKDFSRKNIKRKKISVRGNQIFTPYYHIQNQIVWGATAMIISEFIELISENSEPKREK